ncbi:MAG TPA: phosphoribosylformylglycinamidine synthase subunit PurL, partial [Candidatus Baltobacteraceae bacterium]|nr:phosphoribosylformylglycinamidine synthase subunit PurL [Candidatus Baltobacteraceae bacterium]
AIAVRLGRDPTLVEAHAFDAQWSEHCSYKSSRAHLARLPVDGPAVILGPKEDAGIVRLGTWDGISYGIVIAHESHNHPSQVVPFEGAATGVGGIVRDVLCMGARVIAVADPLRFGPRDDAHARYVAQGVVDGIAAYGNAIGVPNIAGDVYFHEGFRDNVLVNVVALGIVPEDEVIHSAAPPGSAGWDIVLVGKATDRSGIGGAAFSSLVLDEADAEANKGAVQVPDPFLASVLMRASYRVFDVLRERGLTVAFKDLGAGGIMGCTAELTGSGGFGAVIDLDRCPTAVPDLPPPVIAVGETQERLAWVVPPDFTPTLLAIYNEEYSLPMIARGAQAALIGTVSAEPLYVLRHHGVEVMRVPIDFLTGGIRYERPCELPPEPERSGSDDRAQLDVPLTSALLEGVLAHRDVCSRRPIYERYDSVVRGATALPCGYGDAGVLVPIPGAPLGVALSVGGNPRYAAFGVRAAAEHAVCEAVRNVVAVGAQPIGLSDCLNFGNPEDPAQMGEFVAAVDGIAHAARELGTPFVSGNVSLYNQSASGRAVPASPIIACVGRLADISHSLTPSLKRAGSLLVCLQGSGGFGGAVASEVLGRAGGVLPAIDYERERRDIVLIRKALEHDLLLAAHDVSDGGALTAVCEMAFAARPERTLGVELRWSDCGRLFGEFGGYVLEADLERIAILNEWYLETYGTTADWDAAILGQVIAEPVIRSAGAVFEVARLHEVWSAPLRDFYDEVPQ